MDKTYYNARGGISQTTVTKRKVKINHYKSAKFMEKALKAYELTLEEVKNAMETLKAATITNNMVDVSEYAVSTESQEVAIKAEEIVTDNTKYQGTAGESPMFYMKDTSNRTATDKRAPFTTVIELENGDEREQFFDACEAMNHVKKIAAENPTAECQIEDADGDMIYEDDKFKSTTTTPKATKLIMILSSKFTLHWALKAIASSRQY